MKKLLITCVLMATVSMAATAQTNYETYKRTLENNGYTIAYDGYCDLSEGQTCKAFHTFYKGNDYKVVAFSNDGDVTDIDVYLYEKNGDDQIDKDADATDLAVVNFSPSYTRECKIVWKNYASNSPKTESRVRCFICYK